MAKNFTKTLQGKQIDFEELALRNDDVRSVGNMNEKVKLRADNDNDTVAKKTHKPGKGVRRRHDKRVQDAPVMNSKKAAMELAKQYIERELDVIPGLDTITEVQQPVVEEVQLDSDRRSFSVEVGDMTAEKAKDIIKEVQKAQPAAPVFKPAPKEEVSEELLQKVISKSTGGLAGAIAKAKEVKQEPLKTPREEQRSVDGVKRI